MDLGHDFVMLSGMPNIIRRPGWHIPDRLITPEEVYFNRRKFLKNLGFAGAGGLMMEAMAQEAGKKGYPYARAAGFAGADLKITSETGSENPLNFNNFYEFSTQKQLVHRLTGRFVVDPWTLEIGGLCENPRKVSVKELIDEMPLEERVYRFRCVEAWSMVAPWTGFELNKLIEKAKPKAEAKFVRFVTFNKPDQAPGFADTSYPWPYTEGLRLDEAMHKLTLVGTGVYGKPLPKQCGAPIRIVVPWKYGYKSIKSIVKIEFVDKQPKTLWETLAPREYPFESNVDPNVDHPRWSQATERVLGSYLRIKTKIYNGYGDYVASMYKKA
jgi:methionine sulfoxide reductase catalytic subunit